MNDTNKNEILHIKEDTIIHNHIKLIDHIDESQEIIIEKDVSLKLVIIIESGKDDSYTYKSNLVLKSKGNNKIELIKLQILNDNSQYTDETYAILDESSDISYVDIQLGGDKVKSKYHTSLKGNDAKSDLQTIYIGEKNKKLELEYFTELLGKDTIGVMDTKGVLSDHCEKKYIGTIDFKEGCTKAKGKESEKVILLSDKAINHSSPILLCHEEDVSGSHAISAGRIDENRLFYSMSRGFSEKEAKKMLIKASFSSILDHIKEEELYNKIDLEIDRRLNGTK